MDLPQKDRWTHIVADFKSDAPQIMGYLKSQIPKWALPIITTITKDIRPYFADYADEMLGIADAYGLPIGDVVAVNLIYQLESIGLNCSNWNVTGPTQKDDPGCEAVDPKQEWCYCHDKKSSPFIDTTTGILQPPKYRVGDTTGLCTSVVANTPQGSVVHGRNLDWNVPQVLRKLMVDVDFQTNGKTVFTGTTLVGFVGVLNGMQAGEDGWSVSLDARGKGGKILPNIVQALLHKSKTPTQHIRKSLETPCNYSVGVERLSGTDMIDQGYFIVAGARPMEGGVLSRDRNDLKDYWALNGTDPDGWFRLQTNYDHWDPVPVADDRRTPGLAHMKALGQTNVSTDAVMTVMKTYPTYNWHTDYTCVLNPAEGLYESGVWL
eukprot:TRINITY_DN17708_c0_g1_i1.p1 TRINITY_DN17708_c0_g1~~TRINITY_DN17708_c0_g1_i1.p1  ORF type:complete len:378 (+),score=93.02 TRINITY_DN17708_c0_g1_i1:187-1320(+)